MSTVETPRDQKVMVKEMSWDPITRIVGSLGIHTEIDFTNQQVLKCYSTSMIFRGFDIFMKGIDPRDAHFITSRICGICGDNHCTCSCLNQNMAYSVKPPKLGDYAYNIAEAADFIFDHAIFNDCMANVDWCEQMVGETNPKVLEKANATPAPNANIHGYKTIGDIMRSLNPFTGDFYLETLHVARYTREMYCLFGGRHTHPSTIMPGGVSADITMQTCSEYYIRLMRYFDYVKRSVPLHDDLYDFWLDALPGYDMVGFRETNLVNWGCFDDPDYVDYDYKNMTEWGRRRFVTPGVAINGELISTDLVEINLMIRILLGSSYFDGWENERTYVDKDPLGNPVSKDHPWNKTTLPKPQKRDFTDKYSWVTSPRIYDARTDTHVCCDTGGGPFARQWCTAKAGLVDIGYIKATGNSIEMTLPKTPGGPEMDLEWKVPEKSNAIERDRARTYHQAYSALVAFHNLQGAMGEIKAGRTKSWKEFKVPQDAVSVGFHEAARGRAQSTTWSSRAARSPTTSRSRRRHGTPACATSSARPARTRTRCRTRRSSRRTARRSSRAWTSCARCGQFDPCLPCGVHMYNGKGKVRKVQHTPTAMSMTERVTVLDLMGQASASPCPGSGRRRSPRPPPPEETWRPGSTGSPRRWSRCPSRAARWPRSSCRPCCRCTARRWAGSAT